MKDRYEGKSHGHSFGATHDGVTVVNRPILEAFPADWTDAWRAFKIVRDATGRSTRSVRQCINSLLRHGHIERRPSELGPQGQWIKQEHRRKP